MNADGFIRWALDDARTVDERYTVELLVELGVTWWNSRRKIYKPFDLEEVMERKRQRALNPAYEPRYSESDVRKAVEAWPTYKAWHYSPGHDDRPIRDVKAFRFFTHLGDVWIGNSEVSDVSPFAEMPNLRVLRFGSGQCDDLSPLSRCVRLRELHLSIGKSWTRVVTRWPDVTGLEQLGQLETLELEGNLLVFPRGTTWPNVRQAALKCDPMFVRSVRDLPQLPACEFLTLGGVERLAGIEAFPRLRNLTIETDVRDFAPLKVLDKLTCFTCGGHEPVDVSPLIRLPKLQVATFVAQYQYLVAAKQPRDFGVFAEAPVLRELHVENCPPVEAEVGTINSVLLPWDDVLLTETPRPLPRLRMIIAPWNKHPQNDIQLDPEDGGLPDEGLRECEGRWVGRFVHKTVSARLGAADWGRVDGDGTYRRFSVTIEAFAVVEKLPQIVEAMREVMARLRHSYTAMFMIALVAPSPVPTPAQKQLEEKFQEEQDAAEYELRQQEIKKHLDRLHRFELKKQLGEKIKPEDFVPEPRASLPEPPWEREDEADDDEDGAGDVVVKEKPDPPPSWSDDEHPLAAQYRLLGHLTLSEAWFSVHQRDIAIYLMGRQPDLEIPAEKKTE